jgi:hypothetical protein
MLSHVTAVHVVWIVSDVSPLQQWFTPLLIELKQAGAPIFLHMHVYENWEAEFQSTATSASGNQGPLDRQPLIGGAVEMQQMKFGAGRGEKKKKLVAKKRSDRVDKRGAGVVRKASLAEDRGSVTDGRGSILGANDVAVRGSVLSSIASGISKTETEDIILKTSEAYVFMPITRAPPDLYNMVSAWARLGDASRGLSGLVAAGPAALVAQARLAAAANDFHFHEQIVF